MFSRDSSDNIGTAMESLLKTTTTKAKKETRTTATKHPKKGSNEFGNVKKYTTSQSKLTKDFDATQLSVGKTKQIAIKHCTDSTNGKKQSFSDTIEINSDTAIDSNKTFDSQETISEEKTYRFSRKYGGCSCSPTSSSITTTKNKICDASNWKRKLKG